MEFLDTGIKIPAIITPTIITMMVFLMMKVLKYLWMIEYVYIGL